MFSYDPDLKQAYDYLFNVRKQEFLDLYKLDENKFDKDCRLEKK